MDISGRKCSDEIAQISYSCSICLLSQIKLKNSLTTDQRRMHSGKGDMNFILRKYLLKINDISLGFVLRTSADQLFEAMR